MADETVGEAAGAPTDMRKAPAEAALLDVELVDAERISGGDDADEPDNRADADML